MRRKSERNKTKGTPEKKIEKPIRKSGRRRSKRSPSSSPDRDSADDNVSSTPYSEDEKEPTVHTRLQGKGLETITEEMDKNVSSSETIPVPGEDDNGSVWKVARADASPGEIQKLKLCRQRNISETSDVSLGKKKSNKWQDSGEGATEEDSADEQPASSVKTAGIDHYDDPSSSHLGQDSNEEVSDIKENLPETTSAILSDDVTNVDQQNEASSSDPCIDNESKLSDSNAVDPSLNGDNSKEESSTEDAIPSTEIDQEIISAPEMIPSKEASPSTEEVAISEETVASQETKVPEDVIIKEVEETDKFDAENDDTVATELSTSIDTTVPMNESVSVDVSDQTTCDELPTEDTCTEDKSAEVAQDEKMTAEVALDEGTPAEEKETPTESQDSVEESQVSTKENSPNEAEMQTAENQKDSSSENEQGKKSEKEKSPESDSSSTSQKESKKSPPHSTRRKHRSKYRDSSNSDSAESDEEQSRRERKKSLKSSRKKKSSGKVKKDHKHEDMEVSPKKRTENSNSIDTLEPEIELQTSNAEKYDLEFNEKSEDVPSVPSSAPKPAKVSLKRAFSSRVSTDEAKKAEGSKVESSETINENHASEKADANNVPKKRRWGVAHSSENTPAFNISTDSLKALVPGAKPLSLNEVRLTKDEDDDKEHRVRKEKHEQNTEHVKSKDDSSKNDSSKKESQADSAARRKISIVKNTPRIRSPSPHAAKATSVLLIKNLVRPFTLNQIKELLSRTGTIVENGFWMDRIKSKCYVHYANEDQGFETRQALHGISWPVSNPKKLQVEYATKEDMELAREISKDQQISRKTEPLQASDIWQQDWAREERSNATTKITVVREWDLGKEDGHVVKEKEREKKDLEKKRRLRSRSPAMEPHLPPPARKFKKKEDEPPPAKLLDDLFRKTKATPCIYWLPLTNEQIVVKEEMRRQHMAEHARRMEEMRRAERNRDTRRRRSPRK